MIVSYLAPITRSARAWKRLYRLRNVAAGILLFAVGAECLAFAPDYVGFGRLFKYALVVAAIVLALICGGIGASLADDKRIGATFGALVGAGAVGLWAIWFYHQASLSTEEARKASASRQAEFVALKAEFLSLCYTQAAERLPAAPVYAKRVFIVDARNSSPTYLWGLFPSITETSDVGLASTVESVRPENNAFVFNRILNGLTAFGEERINSMKMEIIDSLTGERVGERIDFSLRGTTCLDQEWQAAYSDFSMRAIGYVPGNPRTDAWIKLIPKKWLKAELTSRSPATSVEFKAEVLPSEVTRDSDRSHMNLGETRMYVRGGAQTRLVGLKAFPDRVLAFYSSAQNVPQMLIQVWSRKSSRLLFDGHIMLPREISDSYLKSNESLRWRVANDSIRLDDGKIAFDVIQEELSDLPSMGRYVRYSVVANWIAEHSDSSPLPDLLADGSYTALALPPKSIMRGVSEKYVVGDWVSYPAGAKWNFKSDGTVNFDHWEKPGRWRIDGDGISAESVDSYHWRKFKLRISNDRKFMDVIQTTMDGSYRPFLLTRDQ